MGLYRSRKEGKQKNTLDNDKHKEKDTLVIYIPVSTRFERNHENTEKVRSNNINA